MCKGAALDFQTCMQLDLRSLCCFHHNRTGICDLHQRFWAVQSDVKLQLSHIHAALPPGICIALRWSHFTCYAHAYLLLLLCQLLIVTAVPPRIALSYFPVDVLWVPSDSRLQAYRVKQPNNREQTSPISAPRRIAGTLYATPSLSWKHRYPATPWPLRPRPSLRYIV